METLSYNTESECSLKDFVECDDMHKTKIKKIFVLCKNCKTKDYKDLSKFKHKLKTNYYENHNYKINYDFCGYCSNFLDRNKKVIPRFYYEEYKKNGFLDYRILFDYSFYYSKMKLKGKCENCNKIFYKKWNDAKETFLNNNIGKEIYCQKCLLKKMCQSEKWRLKNSQAQLIAQNKIETKIKNSMGVKNAFDKNNSRDKIKKSINKLWENDLFSQKMEKVFSDKKYLTGYLNGVFFASSYELFFIDYCLSNNHKIERFNKSIQYVDENEHNKRYIPDFLIDDAKIIEIKGGIDNNVKLKEKSALIYANEKELEYQILNYKELKEIGHKKFNKIQDCLKLKEKYGKQIRFISIPKRWKNVFISNSRKKRKTLQRKSI